MLKKKDITVKTFFVTQRHKERCSKMAESVLLMTMVTSQFKLERAAGKKKKTVEGG